MATGLVSRYTRKTTVSAPANNMQRFILVFMLLLASHLLAQEDSRILIGPQNVDLADGAEALLRGDAETGVQLTLAGLAMAAGRDERLTGLANLCAGYLLLGQQEKALDYCNRALAINSRHWRSLSNRALIYIQMQRFEDAADDLRLGQQISPGAEQLKEVRGLLMDALRPVEPEVSINERSANDEKE